MMVTAVFSDLKNLAKFEKFHQKKLLTTKLLSDNIYIREVPVSLLVMSLAKTKAPYRDDVTKR